MDYKKLLPIIGFIILIYLIFTLDLNKIYNVFSLINPFYSFICFFAIIPIVLIVNIQWQILLKKQKIKVSFLYSLKNIFIGYFYGIISPGGLGAYYRAIYLEQESKTPLPKCLSNIIIFNTINYISSLFLAAIGAVILSSIFPYLFVFIIILTILVISLLLFLLKKEKSKIIFTRIIQTRIFSTVKDRLINSLDYFYEDIPCFKDVIILFIIAIISWFICLTQLYFISRLFNIDIPFFYFIFIFIVADIIASIPISIYGLGTRDAALITIFSFFGIAPENVLSFSLFWFVIIWLSPSVIGAFITFIETKKFDRFILNEKTAEKFSDYMKKFPQLYSYIVDIVKKNITNDAEKLVILDVGAGPGLLLLEINKQIPKADIIGID
ncbi:MAG: flippase-like domain-containing protein, partial [Candidatus Thermoplasmatota archaeon]|nr:flippase-like domain-containing protein [Candidatus Thermoplasmatota archaeon]